MRKIDYKTYNQILLEYPVTPIPRYGYGRAPHQRLFRIIDSYRDNMKDNLKQFLIYKTALWNIPLTGHQESTAPCWINGFLAGLDTVALYSYVCLRNPERYIEIGSGYSTRVVRRAINDHKLRTKIISIDPHPRAYIDSLCDEIIRQPLEESDIRLFNDMKAGDILFVDGSHRCFMNSDVTVFFLDVLPELVQGVLIGIHDIRLPYDYPPAWIERFYSEQYLLAVLLLTESKKFKVVLANAFISTDQELSRILEPLWDTTRLKDVEKHGSSLWIEVV